MNLFNEPYLSKISFLSYLVSKKNKILKKQTMRRKRNNNQVAKRKPKYPHIDRSKLTSFSDMLHPSERFGAKIDQMNEDRVRKNIFYCKISWED